MDASTSMSDEPLAIVVTILSHATGDTPLALMQLANPRLPRAARRE
jgi:hypothetical protein